MKINSSEKEKCLVILRDDKCSLDRNDWMEYRNGLLNKGVDNILYPLKHEDRLNHFKYPSIVGKVNNYSNNRETF